MKHLLTPKLRPGGSTTEFYQMLKADLQLVLFILQQKRKEEKEEGGRYEKRSRRKTPKYVL